MLLDTLGAFLLGDILTKNLSGKGKIRAGEGKIKAGKGTIRVGYGSKRSSFKKFGSTTSFKKL